MIGIDVILPNFSHKKSQQGGRWGKGKNKDISLESIANSKSQLPKADDGNQIQLPTMSRLERVKVGKGCGVHKGPRGESSKSNSQPH